MYLSNTSSSISYRTERARGIGQVRRKEEYCQFGSTSSLNTVVASWSGAAHLFSDSLKRGWQHLPPLAACLYLWHGAER